MGEIVVAAIVSHHPGRQSAMSALQGEFAMERLPADAKETP